MRTLLLALVALVLAVNDAMAQTGYGTFTVDTGEAITGAGIVIAALATVWGIRKVIKLVNRS